MSNFDSRLLRICDGLGPAVDAIVYSAAVGHARPARATFHAAAAAAGTVPERCLVVGDSPETDVAGGRAVGCRALLLDRHGRRSGPHVIRALTEIPRFLRGGCP